MINESSDIPSANSTDQSKAFFGGQYHPWRRFFARMVDSQIILFLLIFISLVTSRILIPKRIVDSDQFSLFLFITLLVVWLFAEPLLLSLLGTTPAKYLFGIRVEHPDGSLLSFPEAVKRFFSTLYSRSGFIHSNRYIDYSNFCISEAYENRYHPVG